MAANQQYLNGAYYGPPIAPPGVAYHSHRNLSGGSGCCCGCLRCCGCCILDILITIVVILGIAALIIWFIFRPNVVKFRVTEANLTHFDLNPSNSSNLHYNLALNITIRNPNRRIGIYYDQFEVGGYYGEQRFGSVDVPPFYQGHKNTTVVGAVLSGQKLVVLGGGAFQNLVEDRESGIYRMDVKLRLGVRLKFGILKSWRLKPKIRCHLRVPLSSSNWTTGFQFEDTQCHIDF